MDLESVQSALERINPRLRITNSVALLNGRHQIEAVDSDANCLNDQTAFENEFGDNMVRVVFRKDETFIHMNEVSEDESEDDDDEYEFVTNERRAAPWCIFSIERLFIVVALIAIAYKWTHVWVPIVKKEVFERLNNVRIN